MQVLLNLGLIVLSLWKLYLDICRFRLGPQDVPSSPALMRLLMLVYFIVGVVLSKLHFELFAAIARTLIDLSVMVILTLFLLWWRGHLGRAVQTISAMAGTGIVVSLIASPVLLALDFVGQDSPIAMIPAIIWFGIFCWSIGVGGHILRHALNVNLIAGVMFSVAYVLITLDILSRIFQTVS